MKALNMFFPQLTRGWERGYFAIQSCRDQLTLTLQAKNNAGPAGYEFGHYCTKESAFSYDVCEILATAATLQHM